MAEAAVTLQLHHVLFICCAIFLAPHLIETAAIVIAMCCGVGGFCLWLTEWLRDHTIG